MTLWTILNIFEERRNLPRCLSSIGDAFFARPEVEYINHVFVDGAYADYDSPNRLSEDGTHEYAHQHGHLILKPDVSECAKRNAALEFIDTVARDGDYLLYLDADETITEIFTWPQRVGIISFQRASRREVEYDRCRLYRWEPGLNFQGRHYKLHDASGELVAGLGTAPEGEPCGFGVHYDLSHDRDRVKIKRAYYKVLSAQEESVPA